MLNFILPGKSMKALSFLETYFLWNLKVSGMYHFRARLLVKFTVVSILFALGYLINTYFTGFLAARYGMIIVTGLFVIQLFILRQVSDQWWVAQFFILICWFTVALLTIFSGGITSYVLPWLTLIPVLGLMLLGQRTALLWGAVSIASVFGFYVLDGSYSIDPIWLAPQSDLLTASLVIGLVAIILAMTYVFHGQGSLLLSTIQEQRAIIERQNAEMATRNETLEAEVERRTKELLEYNQQLEQFAFIASHNLRAPVATLLGLGQLLDVKELSEEDRKLISANMITSARELDRVVRDLSTILEMRKSSHELLSRVNLDEEISLIRVSLERELTETNSRLETDFAEVPEIQTVRPLMDSILMNLISNAVKYRHPDRVPKITVRSRREGGEVCLSVRDNGVGMDLDSYGDKLFTLYGRFHSHVDGKGLGLYLVKTHVQAMGGRIEVESEPGKGTAFSVFLKG
jgi:signal transduction histidine kinase